MQDQQLYDHLVKAEVASYLLPVKTLLLFIGTVLRSRIIQRKGLEAIPAIYKLIRYWWAWTPSLPDPMSKASLRLDAKSVHYASLPVERRSPVAQS
jgi:hypothetical protein